MLYTPPHFRIEETDALLGAIAAQPFGMLVSNSPEGPVITHMPLLLDRGRGPLGTLIGHVARANPQWKIADPAIPSVAVFTGADAYVSPNWYPTKKEAGKAVPTWNYSVIHAVGTLTIHDDPGWLRDAVSRLTDRHEGGRSDPWMVSDAPEPFIAAQLKGIVGVALEITRLDGKDKLSQNRNAADRRGVIDGLAGEAGPGAADVRARMQARETD